MRTPKRAGYRKSEDSRRQVLDAAVLTLAKRGLANTSIQDIADAAGLSKGAVHYHFESKDDLLLHVLNRCCENMEARVRAVFEADGPPLERVARALQEMWALRRDAAPEMRVVSELHTMSRQNESLRTALADALRAARQQIIDVGLSRLSELGLKPCGSSMIVPRLILATLDGLMLQHEVEPITKEEEGEILQALVGTFTSLFEPT